jgi:hypothetical protein
MIKIKRLRIAFNAHEDKINTQAFNSQDRLVAQHQVPGEILYPNIRYLGRNLNNFFLIIS